MGVCVWVGVWLDRSSNHKARLRRTTCTGGSSSLPGVFGVLGSWLVVAAVVVVMAVVVVVEW